MQAKRSFGLLLWMVAAIGCATPGPESEALSARRGVGVSGVPAGELRKSLIGFLNDRDYVLSGMDRRTLDFDKPASKWMALRYGSLVNPETFVRMKVILMDVGPADYWVGFQPLIVTERGSGFEREQPFKGKAPAEMQALLESWKSRLMVPPR